MGQLEIGMEREGWACLSCDTPYSSPALYGQQRREGREQPGYDPDDLTERGEDVEEDPRDHHRGMDLDDDMLQEV